ncbi:hypothetical protein [uncultured Roseibium sp.]|uniref:hypothetical protein n=1 Tax=uncultured Roseibium sp. TaxID=1936171 RepID=UPI00374784C1
MIGVFLDDDPALLLGMEAAHAELIRDRRVSLIVGGIAGVDGDLQCASPNAIRSRASSAS